MSRQVLRSKKIYNIQNIKYDNLIYDAKNTNFNNETKGELIYTNIYSNMNILNSIDGYINYRRPNNIRIGNKSLFRDIFTSCISIGTSNCVNVLNQSDIQLDNGVNDPLFYNSNFYDDDNIVPVNANFIIGSYNYTNNVTKNYRYIRCIGYNNFVNEGPNLSSVFGNNNKYTEYSGVGEYPIGNSGDVVIFGNDNILSRSVFLDGYKFQYLIGSSNNMQIAGYILIGNNNYNEKKDIDGLIEENNLFIGNNIKLTNFTENNTLIGNNNIANITTPSDTDYCIDNTIIGNNNDFDNPITYIKETTIIGSLNKSTQNLEAVQPPEGSSGDGLTQPTGQPDPNVNTIIIGNNNNFVYVNNSITIGNSNNLGMFQSSVNIGNNNSIISNQYTAFNFIIGNGINLDDYDEYIIINSYSSPYNVTGFKNSKFKILCPFGSNVSSSEPNGKLFYDAIKKRIVYNIK